MFVVQVYCLFLWVIVLVCRCWVVFPRVGKHNPTSSFLRCYCCCRRHRRRLVRPRQCCSSCLENVEWRLAAEHVVIYRQVARHVRRSQAWRARDPLDETGRARRDAADVGSSAAAAICRPAPPPSRRSPRPPPMLAWIGLAATVRGEAIALPRQTRSTPPMSASIGASAPDGRGFEAIPAVTN